MLGLKVFTDEFIACEVDHFNVVSEELGGLTSVADTDFVASVTVFRSDNVGAAENSESFSNLVETKEDDIEFKPIDFVVEILLNSELVTFSKRTVFNSLIVEL